MNKTTIFILRILRKIFGRSNLGDFAWYTDKYCQFTNQEANDFILATLSSYQGGGFMLSKWGTIELEQAVMTFMNMHGYSLHDFNEIIHRLAPIPSNSPNFSLYNNAGVFPLKTEIAKRFGEQALNDCQLIDILGSYVYSEYRLDSLMKSAIRVNMDPFYAPWLFKNPWTKWLKGKKVVVVHPFIESIKFQYENNRKRLFNNPDVLPEFGSIQYIKAVQTQAGETSQFKDWFEALQYMESELDELDYDVAIIGCGAYGMSLAAHVKRQGKVALHLAGWTQMLFGVFGERWISQQKQYKDVINKYWIRPNQTESLKNSKQIENGCYW